MRILIDTQSLIWSLEDRERITPKAQAAMLATDGVYVSPVSFYELAIKLKIGKDVGSKRPMGEIIAETLASGFQWLPLTHHHIIAYQTIPLFEQHRDPFDRMMLAIAYAEGMSLVSVDRHFPLYHNLVDLIW